MRIFFKKIGIVVLILFMLLFVISCDDEVKNLGPPGSPAYKSERDITDKDNEIILSLFSFAYSLEADENNGVSVEGDINTNNLKKTFKASKGETKGTTGVIYGTQIYKETPDGGYTRTFNLTEGTKLGNDPHVLYIYYKHDKVGNMIDRFYILDSVRIIKPPLK